MHGRFPTYVCKLFVTCAAQLAVEAGAARLRPAGRAGSFSATCGASRRLQRAHHMQQAACRSAAATWALAAQLNV